MIVLCQAMAQVSIKREKKDINFLFVYLCCRILARNVKVEVYSS